MSTETSLVVHAKKTRSDNVIDPSCYVHGRVGWVKVNGEDDRSEYIYDREEGFVPRKRFFEIKRGRAIENERKHVSVPYGKNHRDKRRAEGTYGAMSCRPDPDRLLFMHSGAPRTRDNLNGIDPMRAATA